MEEVQEYARFLMDTDVYPRLLELKELIEQPSKPWYNRAYDAVKSVPELAMACFTLPPNIALARILSEIAGVLVGVRQEQNSKAESVRRSGLYFLLKLAEWK